MGFMSELDAYLDQDGLVNPGLNVGSNNGVLYTSEAYVIGRLQHLEENSDLLQYVRAVLPCLRRTGLLSRHPDGGGGQEGPDDYVGLGSMLYFCGFTLSAQQVIDYGWKNRGFYNNVDPSDRNWKAFLVRQPQLIALFYWAAGKKPILLLRLYTAVCIAVSGRKDNPDSWFLAWLLGQVAIRESWICRFAFELFKKRLLKAYPNGMQDVAATYFEPGHPLIKYWPIS
jgi:hypothetical protein